MTICGLTPIDSALSNLGLNLAQIIVDIFFTQTSLGAVLFAVGFLISLYKVVREGSYQAVSLFFLIFLSTILLILPKKQEGSFQSAQEQWGQSTVHGQVLKDSVVNFHQIPIFLSFLNQGMDTFIFTIIHAMDALIPQEIQFLSSPFGIQISCLDIERTLRVGLDDLVLRKDLDQFLEDHYLPALNMLKNKGQHIEPRTLSPDNVAINAYYSKEGTSKWKILKQELNIFVNKQAHLKENILNKLKFFNLNSSADINDALIKSLVVQELMDKKHRHGGPLWQNVAFSMLSYFPFCYGILQLLLLATFPVFIMYLYLSRSFRSIFTYFMLLCWIKFWAIGAALCSYASLIVGRFQVQSSSDVSTLWERPYFVLGAGIFTYLIPLSTLLLIIKQRGKV